MKKRNRVLEVILCATLAVVVFWGYMFVAKDNGVFEIEDIEGDRAALNAFAFEGLAGDDSGQIHYTWQDGELKKRYYSASRSEGILLLSQERSGNRGMSRFFKQRLREDGEGINFHVEAAPSADARVHRLPKEEIATETLEEIGNTIPEGASIYGVAADKIDIYGVIHRYSGGETRFFTGLQLQEREYSHIKESYGNSEHEAPWLSSEDAVGLCVVDMGDAWVAIPKMDYVRAGTVSLFRIPKKEMAEDDYGEWDVLYSTKQYGKAEPIKTFSVNTENRIVALEKAGDDQMLLARTEQDTLILELYDTKGKLMDRLKTDVVQVSDYRLNDVNMVQRADGLVLWLDLNKTFQEDADGTTHQRFEGTKCFIVREKSIAQIAIDGGAEYVDVQDGRVLRIERTTSKNVGIWYFGWMKQDGLTMTVTDAETGEVLYRGRIKTDFNEDYNRAFSTINIGQREKSQFDADYMNHFNDMSKGQRSFENVLPVEDGRRMQDTWMPNEIMDTYEIVY